MKHYKIKKICQNKIRTLWIDIYYGAKRSATLLKKKL